MQIRVNVESSVPIYLQIVQQVKSLVAAGRLLPGEELPPIRVLAEQLVINPNTVARAYRELELEGLVTKRRAAGTYISPEAPRFSHRERLDLLAERIDDLLTEARQLNLEVADLVDLLRRRAALLEEEPAEEAHRCSR